MSPNAELEKYVQSAAFYKHTNIKEEIGENLKQINGIFFHEGNFREVASFNFNLGGPLYKGHKKLTEYCENEVRQGNYVLNGNRAQVYEVVMHNTDGWAQYLSIILKGLYKKEFANKLSQIFWDANFAPKNIYLGKNDPVITPNTGIKPLWLDEFMDFKPII